MKRICYSLAILVNIAIGTKKQSISTEMEDEWVLNLRPFVAYSILAGWKFKTPFYISNPSLHKYRIIKSHLILMDYKELC
jgi:hypothetical protein